MQADRDKEEFNADSFGPSESVDNRQIVFNGQSPIARLSRRTPLRNRITRRTFTSYRVQCTVAHITTISSIFESIIHSRCRSRSRRSAPKVKRAMRRFPLLTVKPT